MDAVVIGSGPNGLAAAIVLAQAGFVMPTPSPAYDPATADQGLTGSKQSDDDD